MAGSNRVRAALLGTVALLGAACTSPEAERTRGGGPGADPGNVGRQVEMHTGANPYHGTPCLGDPAVCAAEREQVARR